MLETVLSHFKSSDALSARHTIFPPPRMFVEETTQPSTLLFSPSRNATTNETTIKRFRLRSHDTHKITRSLTLGSDLLRGTWLVYKVSELIEGHWNSRYSGNNKCSVCDALCEIFFQFSPDSIKIAPFANFFSPYYSLGSLFRPEAVREDILGKKN